jgi:thiaminase/transcriptional activator TenA
VSGARPVHEDAAAPARSAEGFSARMQQRSAALLERIVAHPYNRALVAGTLDAAIFAQYVVQDALYLVEYGRVLATLAAKAPDAERVLQFSRATEGAIVVERQLHGGFFAQFGIEAAEAARATASPACQAYTDFLHATVHRDGYAVGLAAVLPCFRVYHDVGRRLASEPQAADNPYAAWIATYSDDAFGEVVLAAESAADAAWEAAGATDRARMGAAYDRSVVYEWMFWDSAWRREGWAEAV